MKVTILTKNIGVDVKDKFCGEYKWTLDDGIEDYIKKEFGIDE